MSTGRKSAGPGLSLFLFANEERNKMFQASPPTYANADLAYGGKCVVCSLGPTSHCGFQHQATGRFRFRQSIVSYYWTFAISG